MPVNIPTQEGRHQRAVSPDTPWARHMTPASPTEAPHIHPLLLPWPLMAPLL